MYIQCNWLRLAALTGSRPPIIESGTGLGEPTYVFPVFWLTAEAAESKSAITKVITVIHAA
jgi:hypothetical protein